LGQWAARGKQYLILVRPMEGGLAMEQLKYPEEVRSIADVPIPKTDVKKGELDMAIKVIDQGTAEDFRPQEYKDNVRRRILDQIQQKVEGKEITEEPTEAPKTQIIDLMEALKASLKGGKGGAERKPAKRVEAKAAPKRKAAGGR
jgi:DNA end-binding protein Ku